jgi:NO-binding membrane sensor protein with MHYT domain
MKVQPYLTDAFWILAAAIVLGYSIWKMLP